MKMRKLVELLAVAGISVSLFAGCATTGGGSSAKTKVTNERFTGARSGFLNSYDKLRAGQEGGTDLPDYYYVRPGTNLVKYKKVLVSDFTTIGNGQDSLSGLQMDRYINLRRDLAKSLANSFDGSVFNSCTAANKRINYKDINEIRRLPADAVILGNIDACSQSIAAAIILGGTLMTTEVELKLVDTRTGEEIVSVIDRHSTDPDKIAMPIVMRMTDLLQKIAANPERTPASPIAEAPTPQAQPQKASQTAEEQQQDKPQAVQAPPKRAEILCKAKENCNVRPEPSLKKAPIAKLKAAEVVEKIGQHAAWIKIRLTDGTEGWVYKNLLEM